MHSMHEVSAAYLCVQPLQGSPPVRHPPPIPAFHTAMIYFNIFNHVASSDCHPIHLIRVSEQTALKRQDLPCMYLAHHELGSNDTMLYYIIMIIVDVIAYFNHYGLHALAGARGQDCSRVASHKS